jgi:hypothetical protein
MKKFILLISIFFVSVSSIGQKTLRYNVKIKPKHCLFRVDTSDFIISKCLIKKGTVIKTNKTIKTKCCDSSFNYSDTIKEDYVKLDSTRNFYSTLLTSEYWKANRLKNSKANITISKDSLLVNFWFYKNKKLKSCEVVENSNAPFLSNRKYFLLLKNRQSIILKYNNIEIGALNIPIKIRPGYELNGSKIYAAASSNVANIGTYAGFRVGKIKYSYNKYEDIKSNQSGYVFGIFLGVSNDKLDSLSTLKAGVNGLKKSETRDAVSLSYGLLAIADIADFRIGFMLGIDKAFGNNRNIWNYDNKIWFGIGLGYKLSFLQNPK